LNSENVDVHKHHLWSFGDTHVHPQNSINDAVAVLYPLLLRIITFVPNLVNSLLQMSHKLFSPDFRFNS